MLENIKKEKIALLGLGLENQALLVYLKQKYHQLDITVCDRRDRKTLSSNWPEIKKYRSLKWRSGEKYNQSLADFSLLFRSPGWPLACPGLQSARQAGRQISSPMNFFFALCPTSNIIGVSGTKGKGTTASLIRDIIIASGQKCFLGGNIGLAPIGFLNQIKPDDWIVLELSSFQLEDLNFSPKIAVLTNLFKEHLAPADPNNPNFHRNMSAYLKAKLNLTRWQKQSDCLIVNRKLKDKIPANRLPGRKIYFSRSQTPSSLIGDFNRENIAAAEKVAQELKIDPAISTMTIKNFSNLKHRLELVRNLAGVSYYDNSFSTTPDSTVLDLQSFKKNIILIAGGADKGADFKTLAQSIKQRVKFLVLLSGAGTERIKSELKKIGFPEKYWQEVDAMAKAVVLAKSQARQNDSVLLSTACASFGLFKNYKERGELFQQEVKKLK